MEKTSGKCEYCGGKLRYRQKRWCTQTCAHRGGYQIKLARKKKEELLKEKTPTPKPKRNCIICKKPFTPKSRGHLCCSKSCSEERRIRKNNEYNDKRHAISTQIKVDKPCQDCGTIIRVFPNANVKRCDNCRAEHRKNKISENSSRIIIPEKLGIGIEETKIVKPKKLHSNDPEIQKALDEYLKKGGVVQVVSPQKEPTSLYQGLIDELNDYVSSDLI